VTTLVALALVLITLSFRESGGGGVHRVQSAGATVLHPFQVGAERVARPFRDVYGWFSGLVHARSENKRLRAEVDALRQENAANASARADAERLYAITRYEQGPRWPRDYAFVNTRVISMSSDFDRQVVISAGSTRGIRPNAPVVTSDGLIGVVTAVYARAAKVTLLTDETNAVSAVDPRTGAVGLIRHGQGSGDSLVLDRVTKDLVVTEGDLVVTAGTRSSKYPSLYPRGIPIGRVTSVGQTDTEPFKQIQVAPFADFGSLDSVIVLRSKKPQTELP
jgi:rod shape-determining protein MreC